MSCKKFLLLQPLHEQSVFCLHWITHFSQPRMLVTFSRRSTLFKIMEELKCPCLVHCCISICYLHQLTKTPRLEMLTVNEGRNKLSHKHTWICSNMSRHPHALQFIWYMNSVSILFDHISYSAERNLNALPSFCLHS